MELEKATLIGRWPLWVSWWFGGCPWFGGSGGLSLVGSGLLLALYVAVFRVEGPRLPSCEGAFS